LPTAHCGPGHFTSRNKIVLTSSYISYSQSGHRSIFLFEDLALLVDRNLNNFHLIQLIVTQFFRVAIGRILNLVVHSVKRHNRTLERTMTWKLLTESSTQRKCSKTCCITRFIFHKQSVSVVISGLAFLLPYAIRVIMSFSFSPLDSSLLGDTACSTLRVEGLGLHRAGRNLNNCYLVHLTAAIFDNDQSKTRTVRARTVQSNLDVSIGADPN
jgi:hypothetical protein